MKRSPAARLLQAISTRRIGRNPRHFEFLEKARRGGRDPGRMPRFADDRALMQPAQELEESPRPPRVEGK